MKKIVRRERLTEADAEVEWSKIMGSTRALFLEKDPHAFAAATAIFLAAFLSVDDAPLPPPIPLFLIPLSSSLQILCNFFEYFNKPKNREERERKRDSALQTSANCPNSVFVACSFSCLHFFLFFSDI